MKLKLAAAVLLLLIVSGVGLKFFVFTETRRVQKTMLALQEKLSTRMDGGGLDLALYSAALKPLFASEVSVTISSGGQEQQWLFEHDDLLRAIVSVKQHSPALTVSFDFKRKDVTVSGSTATAPVLVRVERLTVSEPVEPQVRLFIFQRDENNAWRLATVSNPPAANHQLKDQNHETEH